MELKIVLIVGLLLLYIITMYLLTKNFAKKGLPTGESILMGVIGFFPFLILLTGLLSLL